MGRSSWVGRISYTFRYCGVSWSTAGKEVKYLLWKELTGLIKSNILIFLALIIIFISVVLAMSHTNFGPGREIPSMFSSFIIPSHCRIINPCSVDYFLKHWKGTSGEKGMIPWSIDETSSFQSKTISFASASRTPVEHFVLPGFTIFGLWARMGIPRISL